MRSKKVISFLLSLILAGSFCACNNSPAQESRTSDEAAAAAEPSEVPVQTSAEESSAEPEEESSSPESSEESSEQKSSGESSQQENKPGTSAPESTTESPERSDGHENSQQSSPESSEPGSQINTPGVQTQPAFVEATGIRLSDNSLTLYEGNRYILKAYMIPENATERSFSWEWQDNGIISLSSDGTVTALSEGMTEIIARTPNNKTASCMVEVVKRPAYTPQQTEHTEQPGQAQESSRQTEQSRASSPSYPTEITGRYVGAAWFDDAVFVGDSVSVKLQYFADNGSLGNASFLCAVSLGYNNSLWDLNRRGNVHPLYQGRKVTVDEGIRLIGKKKVFIMLGMNDIGAGPDYAISGMIKLTDRILQKNPDVQIYIQSVTPLIKGIRRNDKLNNTNVAIYNEKARRVCAERGFVFVNVAEAVSDSQGNLIYEYCGDPGYMGLHFSNAGCSKWVDYLKRHVE